MIYEQARLSLHIHNLEVIYISKIGHLASLKSCEYEFKANGYKYCNFEHSSLSFLKNVGYQVGVHKMLVIITNREDPDQTASSEPV